jgi:hypothetical protein
MNVVIDDVDRRYEFGIAVEQIHQCVDAARGLAPDKPGRMVRGVVENRLADIEEGTEKVRLREAVAAASLSDGAIENGIERVGIGARSVLEPCIIEYGETYGAADFGGLCRLHGRVEIKPVGLLVAGDRENL